MENKTESTKPFTVIFVYISEIIYTERNVVYYNKKCGTCNEDRN